WMEPVGVVLRAHHEDRHVQVRERVEALPGDRARHLAERLRHGAEIGVALHALPSRLAGDLAPALGQVARLSHLEEAVDALVEGARELLPATWLRVAGA